MRDSDQIKIKATDFYSLSSPFGSKTLAQDVNWDWKEITPFLRQSEACVAWNETFLQ